MSCVVKLIVTWGEANELLEEDIKLDELIPGTELKTYLWRGLKTEGSERRVPLVDESSPTSKGW